MEHQLINYQTPDGKTALEVSLREESVWPSLNQLVLLFERDKSVISRHIRNVFKEGELEKDSVVANFATTATDGKTYLVDYYNLDVIISAGYRVKSQRGTNFRILVVVGILIALQIDNWNENRKEKADIKTHLQNLIADLKRDIITSKISFFVAKYLFFALKSVFM